MNGALAPLRKLNREQVQAGLIGAGAFALLVIVFLLSPWDGGDDWILFRIVAQNVLNGDPLYGSTVYLDRYYFNPPWIALIFIPATLIPARLGWALASAMSLVCGTALLKRWQSDTGYIKPALVLLSPAMLYIVLHGQIDMLVIAGVFLPAHWWGIVALTKPQVSAGLLPGIPRHKWLSAALLTALLIALTFVLFGNWVADLRAQPNPLDEQGNNIWRGLWPFQIPVGVFLIVLGYSRKDERLLLAGSPFLAPYAAMSSLIGPWIAAITFLNDWQAAVVFASWWGAVLLRALGG